MALFSEDDRRRIEAIVREVEAGSASEIVVASVDRSDSYAGPRLLHGLLFGALLASLAHHLFPDLDVDAVLLLQLPLWGLGWLLVGVPGLLRRLLPDAMCERAVQERAARMFTERGVFDTRDHSGVLILLSELEHEVVILGDRGIHARVQLEGWQHHIQHIVSAIAAGRPADGVCEVLEELGEILAEAFPRRSDDTNELSDQVTSEPR